MVDLLKQHLEQHLKQLEDIDRQRLFWLRISGFIAVSILFIIVDWKFVQSYDLSWIFITAGLISAVTWWYWTMMIIRKLLNHKTVESIIMIELVSEIKEIKKEVKNIDQKS
jgi:ABC-type bacteriocin/lantibiotic exporter with double-glycine peptidase domain